MDVRHARDPGEPDESTLQDFSFAVNTDAEEDESYFGPLGFLLLVPLSAGTLAAFALGRAGRAQAALAAAPLYVVGLAQRYRQPGSALHAHAGCADDAARGGRVPLPRVSPCSRSSGRPRSSTHRWHAHRRARMVGQPCGTSAAPTIALRYPPMTETLRGVDLVIPTDATILALVGENDFVYPLYGPWLERRVHTVSGRELGRDRWTNALRLADERGADWIIDNSGVEVEDAPGWELVYRFPDNGWTLLRRAAR